MQIFSIQDIGKSCNKAFAAVRCTRKDPTIAERVAAIDAAGNRFVLDVPMGCTRFVIQLWHVGGWLRLVLDDGTTRCFMFGKPGQPNRPERKVTEKTPSAAVDRGVPWPPEED